MTEIDLMSRYPKTRRDTLLSEREAVSDWERAIAQKFGPEYFDGPRRLGLGGYKYDPRFWTPVVQDMIEYYGLVPGNWVLDVGCGKGFMMYDFTRVLPGINVRGVDISDYVIENAVPAVKKYIAKCSCDELLLRGPFDLVVSIATIHNLDLDGVKRSLEEIMRVSKRDAYIKVNGYRNDDERVALERWNLVAKTILHVDQWRELFAEVGYTGDYSFFTP